MDDGTEVKYSHFRLKLIHSIRFDLLELELIHSKATSSVILVSQTHTIDFRLELNYFLITDHVKSLIVNVNTVHWSSLDEDIRISSSPSSSLFLLDPIHSLIHLPSSIFELYHSLFPLLSSPTSSACRIITVLLLFPSHSRASFNSPSVP
ncbi:hypothetical protein RIF29_26060 [Crotalaria pallida]|uniref:Uncharacterized protein n=1 Tax=Crotalaria pallida TaxID=3830 RepID=A0AAN9EUK4_CROPI